MSDSIIERLRHHAKDERNTAFARSTMREAEQELSRVTAQRDNISDRLRASLDDPMWADHAEISKSLLRATLLEIDSLRAELAHYKQAATKLSAETYDLEAELTDSRERKARMRGIGGQLSNVAFNLAQRAGHVISSDDCSLLDGLRKQWDAALAEGAQG